MINPNVSHTYAARTKDIGCQFISDHDSFLGFYTKQAQRMVENEADGLPSPNSPEITI